ncbi:uncharacterized protein LOC143624300 [Bidens hawaiensis]|uniref:uncharacterized protein LOC143624300 n=1 Tax=Bidens hawaiensis TaxID=980011 RepID=UPI00404A1F07
MVTVLWRIRKDDDFIPDYGDGTVFFIELNHGGKFPGRRYLNGKVNNFDLVDSDVFSIHELNTMIEKLGFHFEGKVFRARAKAKKNIEGAYTAQYALLRDYSMELQATNIDTTVKIEVEPSTDPTSDTRMFKRIYICPGPLKRGFNSGMRPILGLDGTFMKGNWPGQILTAVGSDANNGIYPVAYAVVESESTSSWTWFLELAMTLGIIPAIENHFPSAEHRFCVFMARFKPRNRPNRSSIWFRGRFSLLTFERSVSNIPNCNESKFFFTSSLIILKHLVSNPTVLVSALIIINRDEQIRSKCDVLLNNMCEVFNRQLLEGRDKPIITCLEYIREYIMRKIAKVQKVIQKSQGPLSPNATEKFKHIKAEASKCKVQWNGLHKFQRVCSCRRWELAGIPCKHVVASIWNMAVNGHQSLWPKSPWPTTLRPPKHHTPISRPKKKRNKSSEELSQKMDRGGKMSRLGKPITCGICKQEGHNRRSYNEGQVERGRGRRLKKG